ncbi:MAG: hypothetical protein ACXWUH_19040, partial [Burkholderiales bacterium]
FVEADRALRRFRGEIGCFVADVQCHVILLLLESRTTHGSIARAAVRSDKIARGRKPAHTHPTRT